MIGSNRGTAGLLQIEVIEANAAVKIDSVRHTDQTVRAVDPETIVSGKAENVDLRDRGECVLSCVSIDGDIQFRRIAGIAT